MTMPPAPTDPRNDAAIGMRLTHQGLYTQALPHLLRAHASLPRNTDLLHATASVLQIVGRADDAVRCYETSARLLADDVGVLVGWARALLITRQTDAATPLLDRALTLQPAIAASNGSLRLLWNPEHKDTAASVLRKLVDRHPDNIDLLCQLAQALQLAEFLDDAERTWHVYMRLRPDDPLGPVEAGRLAVGRGDRDEAGRMFERALQLAPDDSRALAESAQLANEPLSQAQMAQLEAAASRERNFETIALLNDALARQHDRAGRHDRAALHVARMNQAKLASLPPSRHYDQERHAEDVAYAARTYTPALFERLRGAGSTDHRPVFVIGLPRSGTTLLERMLAAHPAIVGVGEQPFARQGLLQALAAGDGLPDHLSPAAIAAAAHWHLGQLEERLQRQANTRHGERIVDKLPDNYLLAGWIKIAFPDAILIHSLRDPRDVAWSCWSTHFAKIDWSLKLEHIIHRIEQHRLLMRHWRASLGSSLVEVRHERLVAEPEVQLRRLLAALGLDWHPDVLDFAGQRGFVASASRHQVREGINRRGIGRWRNYTDALAPILPRLEAVVAQDAREATADLRA